MPPVQQIIPRILLAACVRSNFCLPRVPIECQAGGSVDSTMFHY